MIVNTLQDIMGAIEFSFARAPYRGTLEGTEATLLTMRARDPYTGTLDGTGEEVQLSLVREPYLGSLDRLGGELNSARQTEGLNLVA